MAFVDIEIATGATTATFIGAALLRARAAEVFVGLKVDTLGTTNGLVGVGTLAHTRRTSCIGGTGISTRATVAFVGVQLHTLAAAVGLT